jgi:hypothetical protein
VDPMLNCGALDCFVVLNTTRVSLSSQFMSKMDEEQTRSMLTVKRHPCQLLSKNNNQGYRTTSSWEKPVYPACPSSSRVPTRKNPYRRLNLQAVHKRSCSFEGRRTFTA